MVFFVDFYDNSTVEALQKFPKKAKAILLAKPASLKRDKKQNALPDDEHYTPAELHRLFLRPEDSVSSVLSASQEIEKQSNADDYEAHEENTLGDFDTFSELNENISESFDDGFVSGENFVQPTRVVEKIKIDYAKKAKKVDVKKLKAAIWKEIDANKDVEEEKNEAESVATKKSFCDSLSVLAPKLDDSSITVPFYFICILHLANEKGLKLDGTEDLSDFIIKQN